MNKYQKVVNRFSNMLFKTGVDNSEDEGYIPPSFYKCRKSIRKDNLSFDYLLREKNKYMSITKY